MTTTTTTAQVNAAPKREATTGDINEAYADNNDDFPKSIAEFERFIANAVKQMSDYLDSGNFAKNETKKAPTEDDDDASNPPDREPTSLEPAPPAGEEALKQMKMVNSSYFKRMKWRSVLADTLLKSNYPKLAYKLLKAANEQGIFKSDDIWFWSWFTLNLVWNSSDVSTKLAAAYAEVGFVKFCLSNIAHKPYLDNCEGKNVAYVLKSSISILLNISKVPELVHIYRSHNAIEPLKHIATKGTDFIKAIAIMTLYNILDEKEAREIGDIKATITFIVISLGKALESERQRCHGLTVLELCDVLKRISANEDFKLFVVEEGVLPTYVKVMERNGLEERRSCVEAVWNLTFNGKAREIIKSNARLMELLREYETDKDSELAHVAQGAIWKLDGKDEQHVAFATMDAEQIKRAAAQPPLSSVFISYSWAQQTAVLNINEALKAADRKTWIDVEQMKGSMLEAMAKGIEEAAVVLICVSDTYKLSPNCRQEAEYAYSLHKPLIPLMMTQNYRPDGWLGMLVGAKLFFNFQGREKYPFDAEMKKLINAIDQQIGSDEEEEAFVPTEKTNGEVYAAAPNAAPVSRSAPPGPRGTSAAVDLHCFKWSNAELRTWLTGLCLSKEYKSLAAMDGSALRGTYNMRSEAPDFFYNLLLKTLEMTFEDIIKFINGLDALE